MTVKIISKPVKICSFIIFPRCLKVKIFFDFIGICTEQILLFLIIPKPSRHITLTIANAPRTLCAESEAALTRFFLSPPFSQPLPPENRGTGAAKGHANAAVCNFRRLASMLLLKKAYLYSLKLPFAYRIRANSTSILSMMKHFFLLFIGALLSLGTAVAQNSPQPKREFRGAWIQFINGQFQGLSRDAMQGNLTNQLDALQKCGVNAVMFQVRGEADAFYESPYEPWSRYLTGRQGQRPAPYWDPLAWMVDECHKRGMELHAWINPFRAKTKGTTELAATHPYVQHPERFFKYDNLILFDPGMAENRKYICSIAADIVRRYDVDGLHIDDYFYPYPVAGLSIPDAETYAAHRNGIADINDWRRYNVNTFIQMLGDSIHAVKPWVKFGVSPFGIYHNIKEGTNLPGSKTKGLQNYDDLYADVLFWVNNGWVDYLVPQIYWEIGHPAADYDELIHWWSRFAAARPLYIGQDVERTVRAADINNPAQNQMAEKMRLQRTLRGIQGSCLWYSAAVARDEGGFATELARNYHRTLALQPLYPFLGKHTPAKPRKVKAQWMPTGYYLFWLAPKKAKRPQEEVTKYVVYRFGAKERIDLERAEHIVAITDQTCIKLPYTAGKEKFVYVVTSLDRLQNESKPVKVKVKL